MKKLFKPQLFKDILFILILLVFVKIAWFVVELLWLPTVGVNQIKSKNVKGLYYRVKIVNDKVAPPPPPPPPVKDVAANGLYVALGLTAAQFNPSCGCNGKGDKDKTAGLIGRVGYDFNEYFGIEGRGIRTNWKSEGGKIKHAGVFLKPMYPVADAVNVYGLAGYAKSTTEGISKQRVDTKGLAWGLGLEYDLSSDKPQSGKYNRAFDGYGDQEGGFGLFADYERLIQKSGSPDLDTVNFGVTYDF